MKKEERALVLKEKWNSGAHEAPSARALDMLELTDGYYMGNPFPLSLNVQKRLLELIYHRKSGIITRQEIIDVLYNQEVIKPSATFERLY